MPAPAASGTRNVDAKATIDNVSSRYSGKLELRRKPGCAPLMTDGSGSAAKNGCEVTNPPAQTVGPRPLDPIQDPRSPLFDIRSIPGTKYYDPRCDPQSKVFDEKYVQTSRSEEVLRHSQKLHDLVVSMGWRPDAPPTEPSGKPKTPIERMKDAVDFVLRLPEKVGDAAGDAAHAAGNKAMGVDEDHPQPLTPEQQAWKETFGGNPRDGLHKVPEGLADHGAEAARDVGTRAAEKVISTGADAVVPGAGQAYERARQVDELAHTGEQKDSRYIKKD